MLVEVITSNDDPDRGGFGARVHGIVSMFSRFADVRVVRTDSLEGPRIPGVKYVDIPLHGGLRTRIGRVRTYYRTRFPRREPVEPPDLVVVESLDLLGLHQFGPRVPTVLDEHNVYWNLLTYQLADAPFFRGWFGRSLLPRQWFLDRLLDRARRFEVRAIRASARILVTSDIDRQAIVAECPDASSRVHVLPNCVDVERFPALPEHPDSRDVVFVGDFNYVPNREAAEFVSRTLARGIPQARFLLVGSNPPGARDRPSNVVATGRVPDLGPILRDAAVCIAPLAHGSGTRIKILTYLASARPVVATTKACEGLPVLDGVHLLIRDDPREFRDAVRWLLDDAGARRSLASRGRELIASKLDWKVHVPWLREFAAEVCSGAGATASSRDFRTRSEPSPTR